MDRRRATVIGSSGSSSASRRPVGRTIEVELRRKNESVLARPARKEIARTDS